MLLSGIVNVSVFDFGSVCEKWLIYLFFLQTNHINNVDSVTSETNESVIPKQARPDNLPPKEKPKSQKALNEDVFDEVG